MWFFNGFFTGRRSPKFTSRDRFMFDAGRSYEAELRGDKGTPWSEVKAQLFPDSPASSPEPAQGESDWAVLMSNMLYTLETDNAGHLRVNGLEYELMPSRTMKEGSERG